MKRLLSKIASLLMAVALCASVPVFAAGTPSNNEGKGPLTPTPDMTWGDVVRYFDSEGYELLPDDIQRQLNECRLNLDDDENQVCSQSETGDNGDEQKVESVGILTPNAREVNLSGVLLTLRVGAKKGEITYNSELSAGLTCPYMYVSAFLYDAETNEMCDFDSTSKSNTKSCQLEGSFDGLENKHEYRVVSNGLLTPPTGYAFSGIAPAEITKETK